MAKFNCAEKDCKTEIDTQTAKIVTLRTGCFSSENAYICPKCGRIHWNSGEPASNRSGKHAYVKNDKMVLINPGT